MGTWFSSVIGTCFSSVLGHWLSSREPAPVEEIAAEEGAALVASSEIHEKPQKDDVDVGEGKNEEKGREISDLSISEMEKRAVSEDDDSSRCSSDTAMQAAVKVQKVYRSYRTRRNFADWAVVNEELWWQAIEYATLTKNTEGYFNNSKLDTAESRWSRGKIKAAKVGKGLSRSEKAKLLAFQHWLEAIDPQHRYGHNLHFYYDEWYKQQTDEPFFYWLDVGGGKNVTLGECPREKLRKQRIKYLSPKERERYEVVIKDGLLVYKQDMQPLNTPEGSKWIFVMSTSEQLYVGRKQRGTFQHSSFLAGAAISAAGRLIVENGKLKSISRYSGHYLPTDENLQSFITFLVKNGVDMTDVELKKSDDELSYYGKEEGGEKPIIHQQEPVEEFISKRNFANAEDLHVEKQSLSAELFGSDRDINGMNSSICSDSTDANGISNTTQHEALNYCKSFNGKDNGKGMEEKNISKDDGKVYYKKSLSSKDLENQLPQLPCEEWIKRLHSAEPLKSGQFGKLLSCKWASGTGLRIGCVAVYPPEIRSEALKQVLSPRSNSPRTFAKTTCAR